jgi:hypothetical protein
MKVTAPTLGLVAALVFLVAGCGNGHTAASSVSYKKSPAMVPTSDTATSKAALEKAVTTECAAIRSVRRSADKLSGQLAAGHVAQFAAQSPAWAMQLATAAKPTGKQGAPTGTRAGHISVRLSHMTVDLDLGNLDYGSKQKAKVSQAAKRYAAFMRVLKGTKC